MSELYVDAAGDPRNAHYLARASALAYRDEPAGQAGFRDELSLDAKLISVGNTQVYVAQNDAVIVLAFRGSQAPTSADGLKDWLVSNADNFLIIPEGRAGSDFAAAGVGARFHRGFVDSLGSVWDPLFAATEEAIKQKERPVWVTGHSLGGALAQLGAWRLHRNFVPVHQVYTFGAPMVGNADASAAFEQNLGNKVFRFVDPGDLVPKLPTISLIANAFAHCPTEVALGETEGAGANIFEFMKGLGSRAVNGVIGGDASEGLWDYLKGSITHHLMPNYLTKLSSKLS